MGRGGAWKLDTTHILLQDVRFVEARRDFENSGFPSGLFIILYLNNCRFEWAVSRPGH